MTIIIQPMRWLQMWKEPLLFSTVNTTNMALQSDKIRMKMQRQSLVHIIPLSCASPYNLIDCFQVMDPIQRCTF